MLADRAVKVVDVEWHGSNAITLTFTDESTGKPGQELLYRDDEPRLEHRAGRAGVVDGCGRLAVPPGLGGEADLARLSVDPFLAVQTSNLDPLPHQIEAVYSKMLPRQPLRYLLADDPGAGKTIMAGLFCKELMIRGDVERCLVIAPGSLVEQWQDELWQKFGLSFEILTREMIETSRSGNPFGEKPLLIARLDHLSAPSSGTWLAAQWVPRARGAQRGVSSLRPSLTARSSVVSSMEVGAGEVMLHRRRHVSPSGGGVTPIGTSRADADETGSGSVSPLGLLLRLSGPVADY